VEVSRRGRLQARGKSPLRGCERSGILAHSHLHLPWRLGLLRTGKSQLEPFEGGVELQFDQARGFFSDVGRHGNRQSVRVRWPPRSSVCGIVEVTRSGGLQVRGGFPLGGLLQKSRHHPLCLGAVIFG
jgi:hypothetical protein